MRQKKYQVALTGFDIIDVMFIKKKNKIIKFALNYRAFINGSWHEIYRVDNYHNFLHEQRFWRSSKPIHLKGGDSISLNQIMLKYLEEIKNNYSKYKLYFEKSRRGRKE